MLALAKKTNYTAYDPSTHVPHFLNAITDPTLAQAKLLFDTNCKQYSGNFDAIVEYLMNQVLHHQVNQQLNIDSVGSGASSRLRTHDDCRNNLEMPVISYLPKEWAQLLSAQKSSIPKHHTAIDGKTCENCSAR